MKNIKTWQLLLGIGLITKFLSYIIQYISNINGSSLGSGAVFMFDILLLFISPIFLIIGMISFLLYVAAKSSKINEMNSDFKKQFIVFIFFVLIYLLIFYIKTIAPAPAYHW